MKKTTYFLHLICILLSTMAYGQTMITGIVINSENEEPMENVNITLLPNSLSTSSNGNGYFTFKNVTIGKCSIAISHIGFNTLYIDSLLYENKNYIFKLRLTKNKANENIIFVTANEKNINNRIAAIDLKYRPVNTSQDILRMVPSLFIAQHAGGGKAEQIFLRGFDIDHGTDLNIQVDGLPVNMVSHAHGQGYADLHFLIPETINKVDFEKGPYNATKGNLATAGFVDFTTKEFIDKNNIKLEKGSFGTNRITGMLKLFNKKTDNTKQQLYLATEYNTTRGFFEKLQQFTRLNIFSKYTLVKKDNLKFSIVLSSFSSKWNASGQIPERAVASGLITRLGSIDDNEGGETSRNNFSIILSKKINTNWEIKNQLYAINNKFNLFSNFTLFLYDSLNGDMINQNENRNIYGYNSTVKNFTQIQNTKITQQVGVGVRCDFIKNIELSNAPKRVIYNFIQKGSIKELNTYAFINEQFTFNKKLTVHAGIRYDNFLFKYRNTLLEEKNFSSISKNIFSPKLVVNYKLKPHLTATWSNGIGFHSNDTRVILKKEVSNILPKVYANDLGFTYNRLSKLLLNTTFWHLYSEQEFVYVGDAGIVEASGKTRRYGLDFIARYQINKWLFADVDFNITKAKAIEERKGEDYIPLSPLLSTIGGLRATITDKLNTSIRYRYLGDRPANEDNTVVAKGYYLLDAIANYTHKNVSFNLSIENVLNKKWKEAQFNTESRLQNEPNAVTEIHFTPGTPFFLKFGIAISF